MDEHALADTARLTARAAALFVPRGRGPVVGRPCGLGQMRMVEEKIDDPARRREVPWGRGPMVGRPAGLRRALERFVAAGEGSSRE